jgi:hypothetical protein
VSIGNSEVAEIRRRWAVVIQAYLKKHKIKQAVAAQRLGISQATVSRAMSSDPKKWRTPGSQEIARVAKRSGWSAHWILTEDGPMEAPDVKPGTVVREYEVGYQAGLRDAGRAVRGLTPETVEPGASGETSGEEQVQLDRVDVDKLGSGRPQPGATPQKRRGASGPE